MFPSILIQFENGPNEFYFYFYFVLRHLLVAKKICKTKNIKTMALPLVGQSIPKNKKTRVFIFHIWISLEKIADLNF